MRRANARPRALVDRLLPHRNSCLIWINVPPISHHPGVHRRAPFRHAFVRMQRTLEMKEAAN